MSDFTSYKLGVLTAAKWFCDAQGQPGMAADMVAHLLHGESLDSLRRQCRKEGLQFPRRWWIDELVPRR